MVQLDNTLLKEEQKWQKDADFYQSNWSDIQNELDLQLDKSKWTKVKSNNWSCYGKNITYYQHNSKDLIIKFNSDLKSKSSWFNIHTNNLYHHNGQINFYNGWSIKLVKQYSKINNLIRYANNQ